MKFFLLLPAAAFVLSGAVLGGCARGGYGFGPIPQGSSGPAPVGAGAPTPGATCRSALKSVPDPQAPHGLFVWIDSLAQTKNQPAILQYLPQDANLCGASIVVEWSAIDRGPSASPQYDYAPLESAIEPWATAGKLVNLLFADVNETGAHDTATPAWVLTQTGAGKVDSVACPDPGAGQSVGPPTPVYWEAGFEKPYRAFIKAVVAKYGGDPRIGYMRFGVGPGAEDFVAHGADGACFSKWKAYGLSARSWAAYSVAQVNYVAGLHSKAQQLVALNQFDDATQPYDVPAAVASAAAAAGVGFGTENLGSGPFLRSSTPCKSLSPVPYWCAAFDAHAGRVPLQFQTISYTLDPDDPNLPQLPALVPYGITNHAQIFELYPQDWLTADDPTYASYPAHHGAWAKALASAAALLGGSP
jgi:hypothetical protein